MLRNTKSQLIIIFLTGFILYYPVLSTYFSHDDFFHFIVSQPHDKTGGYLYFLGFHPFSERGIAFYRPLFREFLYGPFYQLFGLYALPFRILQFMLHFTNITLFYNLIAKLLKDKRIAFFSSFFFAISSSNVATLYYLAGGIQTLGALFFTLVTLTFFQKYLTSAIYKYKFLAFNSFLLALASHEQAAFTPFLLLGLIFLTKNFKLKIKNKLIMLWPFFLVTIIYIYLNFTIIGFSEAETQYQISLNIERLANSLAWYGGWALGLPEMLIDFVRPGLKLDSRLMRYWGNYFVIILPSFIISVSILLSAFLFLIAKKSKILLSKHLWFFAVWFILGILPVIILPQHKSGHYLYVSLPAFWAATLILVFAAFDLLKYKLPKISALILAVLIISLSLLSSTSAILGNRTYWASQRGKLAEKLIIDVKEKYPNLPKGAAIYFINDPTYPYVSEDWGGTSKQAYYALNNQDALQLLYKDSSLKIFYEDLGGIPLDIPSDKVYSLETYIQ